MVICTSEYKPETMEQRASVLFQAVLRLGLVFKSISACKMQPFYLY